MSNYVSFLEQAQVLRRFYYLFAMVCHAVRPMAWGGFCNKGTTLEDDAATNDARGSAGPMLPAPYFLLLAPIPGGACADGYLSVSDSAQTRRLRRALSLS
jgi:hypothetical protein